LKLRVALLATAVVVVTVPAARPADFVYFSEFPAQCALEPSSYAGQTFSVFVLADDLTGVTGLSFRVESDRFDADNVVSVTARPGVTIEGGNIFDGVTLSLDGLELHHTAVLDVVLSGHEAYGETWMRDVELVRGSEAEALPDQCTNAQAFDCFVASPYWEAPDTADAVVGAASALVFLAGLSSGSYPQDGVVHVADEAGWIDEAGTYPVDVACGRCPWSGTVVTVPVTVPQGVPAGTLDEVTLEMYSFGAPVVGSRTVILRAVSSVSTDQTTWGRVKSLYR